MKNWKNIFAAITLSAFIAAPAIATTSSVNPTVPATNAPLSSSTIRNGIALPAYNDINTLFAASTSASLPPIANNTIMGNISGGTATPIGLTTSQIDTLLGLGTAAFVATGTSGATLPFANGVNTWSSLQTLSGGILVNGVAKVNLNAAALPGVQTGTVLQKGNADGVTARDEVDCFGAACHFTAVRWDGTNVSPTALLSADNIGSFNVFGYNGTAVVGPQAAFRCFANQNWSVGSNGTYCDIATTPNGSTTLTQAVQFNNDGGVVVGSPTGGDKGAGTLNATALYLNGTLVSTTTGGGGSGTVNAGTTPDLGYYATSTAALSDAIGLQYNATTKGLNLNGVNAHSLPDNGLDTTGVAIGATALAAQTVTGSNNTAVGNNALHATTTATDNTAIGNQALSLAVSDSGNTAVGSGALKNMAIGNTTTLGANTAVGFNALNLLTTAAQNVAVGYSALKSATGGTGNNTALGYNAGGGITNSNDITAVGSNAASNVTTNSNKLVCIGGSSCFSVTVATQSVCVGYACKIGGSGSQDNVTVGNSAGNSGTDNTVIGSASGNSITGSSNTLLGFGASSNKLTSGSSNIVIGPLVASTTLTTGSSNILLGTSSGIDTPAAGTSNYLNIGNMIVGDKSKGILIFEGPTTALGSCGTSPTLKAGSNDMSGEITVGSTTASCVLNFANTHTAAPNCVVTSQSTLAAFTYSASTTALTIGATTLGGDVVDYFCPAASTSTNPTP